MKISDERHIPAAEFKARCLKLMDQVRSTRRPVVITKRGKPVARLVPVEEAPPKPEIFGCMKGTSTVLGDITESIDDVEWHAEQGILYIGEDEDGETEHPGVKPR